jgi:hypothetical protein
VFGNISGLHNCSAILGQPQLATTFTEFLVSFTEFVVKIKRKSLARRMNCRSIQKFPNGGHGSEVANHQPSELAKWIEHSGSAFQIVNIFS